MFCTRNTSNLWKDTRENTSKTCKRHMGDTWWSDTMKHININKYWYHSLCSPYDESYFSGMVQKKCANSQELWIGPKKFFCQTEKFVEPRAFRIGVLSNAATIRLSSLEFSRRQWHISATAGRYPWKKEEIINWWHVMSGGTATWTSQWQQAKGWVLSHRSLATSPKLHQAGSAASPQPGNNITLMKHRM